MSWEVSREGGIHVLTSHNRLLFYWLCNIILFLCKRGGFQSLLISEKVRVIHCHAFVRLCLCVNVCERVRTCSCFQITFSNPEIKPLLGKRRSSDLSGEFHLNLCSCVRCFFFVGRFSPYLVDYSHMWRQGRYLWHLRKKKIACFFLVSLVSAPTPSRQIHILIMMKCLT